jgi:hypothetical protein
MIFCKRTGARLYFIGLTNAFSNGLVIIIDATKQRLCCHTMEPITSHSQAGTIQDVAFNGETCRKLDPLLFNQAAGYLEPCC